MNELQEAALRAQRAYEAWFRAWHELQSHPAMKGYFEGLGEGKNV